jgi:glycosyltransferase involved in cell wall biosynthesis
MIRRKIAIVHPRIGRGGSECVAAWMMEALKSDEVTLVTNGPVDVAFLNQYYGTSLGESDFAVRQIPMPWPLTRTEKLATLRGSFLQRFCSRIAPTYDVVISAYGPLDVGIPAIQCIADFSFDDDLRNALDPGLQGPLGIRSSGSAARSAYLGVCGLVSRTNGAAWERNLTLANSQWSARLCEERFGISATVLYPPLCQDISEPPRECHREPGFVALGRISPEKRLDLAMDILAGVRKLGHDVHLHIAGGADDRTYEASLRRRARELGSWIAFEGPVQGDAKRALLSGHRFGIHARSNEAFGIAVAELAAAGCVTFVPDGGGQTEVVNSQDLVYSSPEAAIAKIDRVLGDPALEGRLRFHLSAGSARFSTDAFMSQTRAIVDDFARHAIS